MILQARQAYDELTQYQGPAVGWKARLKQFPNSTRSVRSSVAGSWVPLTPGVAQASVATDEITMLQVFDLNDDGISELVTEEIEGRGMWIL